MDISDEIQRIKSNGKPTLLRSMSSNNFGTTFSYDFNSIKREKIKSSKYQNKTAQKNNRLKSGKTNLILPDEQIFFSQIKDEKVRNFYESILKHSCREKEPKTKYLKNIFRIKNKRPFLLNLNVKNEIEKVVYSRNNNNKKSRTSNNLPFIQLSQNIKSPINYINKNEHSKILNDIENINNISNNLYNKNKKYSIFLKKNNGNKEIKIKENINNILPKSFSVNKKNIKDENNNSIKNKLILLNNESNKIYKLLNPKKNKKINGYDKIISELNSQFSKFFS